MSNNGYSGARRSLTAAMIVFAAAYTLHGIDHLRRGMAASPPSIMVGGTIQGIIVVIASCSCCDIWFSWVTAVAEIGAGLVLGYVGLRARWHRPVALPKTSA
ncbi:MAG: hypothetical protein ACXVX1_11700 [Mycobacterium sp.]